ncbi:hypothetical protein C8J57DRAFT_1245098 [Mycena rebaudengoi]|nr:hypothetical protein C8J57DRAFT_1245098 [Mycena rebaudengoi]
MFVAIVRSQRHTQEPRPPSELRSQDMERKRPPMMGGKVISAYCRQDATDLADPADKAKWRFTCKCPDLSRCERFQVCTAAQQVLWVMRLGGVLRQVQEDRMNGVMEYEWGIAVALLQAHLKECEVVIFYNALKHAITLAHAYIDRSDTKFFEPLFDIFREIKIEATGKDIRSARFMPNSNLLVIYGGSASSQSAASLPSTLSYSRPTSSNSAAVMPSGDPLPEFRSLVLTEDYRRLKDLLHIDSVESLRAFADFIQSLGVKKIQDWWAHKEMNDWVIPCLVKSQPNILPKHLDTNPATTNSSEAQNHWRNSHAGIKLTLVEGIESNFNKEMFHRLGRNSQRHSNAAKKAPESANTECKAELQAKINDKAAELKPSKAEYKLLTDTADTSSATPILPTNEAGLHTTIPGLSVPSVMLPSYVNDLSYNSDPPMRTDFSTIPMDGFGDLGLAFNQQPNSPNGSNPAKIAIAAKNSHSNGSTSYFWRWSHRVAHVKKTTRWLQWLLRKLSNIAPVEHPVASTPPPIAIKDIDLEFNEKNIVHSKRVRTMSSRAAALPPAKKPRSR